MPGYTTVYIGRSRGELHDLGSPYTITGRDERAGAWSDAEVRNAHEEAVRLYRRWAVEGHMEEQPRPGVRADKHRLMTGRQAHDIAIEALATRVRRGEKLVLMCHCLPRPCHGRVVAELVRAALDRGRWAANGPGEQGIFEKWLRTAYWDD